MDPSYNSSQQQPPPPAGRAATWGKKGVTAKQRQQAFRQARLDPLSADEYARQQALLASGADSGTSSAMGSRRGSMDPRDEAAFVRAHGLGGSIGEQGGGGDEEDEANMKPHSPLLDRKASSASASAAASAPSVKRFWNNQPAIPAPNFGGEHTAGQQQQAGQFEYISRPARTKMRGGDTTGAPTAGAAAADEQKDPTMVVTEVLTGMRRQNEAQQVEMQQLGAAGGGRDEADTESQALAAGGVRRTDTLNRPAEAKADDANAQQQQQQQPPPMPLPAPMPGPCDGCCPCMDRLDELACCSYISQAFSTLFGHDGTREALHEMRHGVVLAQDATKPNSLAIEKSLGSCAPGSVINLRITRTDELLADGALVHPMVRVHIVDLRTGKYWAKRDPARHVVAPYENLRGGGGGDGSKAGEEPKAQPTILPILSAPYNLRSQGSFLPQWDETLLLNEPLRHILSPFALLLFEVVEFGPHLNLDLYPDGMYPVAWGFLKPLNLRGEPNLGTNMRLQLYQYTNMGEARLAALWPLGNLNGSAELRKQCLAARRADAPRVYFEWVWQKNTGRVRYPSTLWMGLSGVVAPQRERVRGTRPTLPTQIEEGRMDYQELLATVAPDLSLIDADGAPNPQGAANLAKHNRKQAVETMSAVQRAALVRRRRALDPCLLPTAPLHSISCGPQGCFALRYSPDGRTLAAACGDALMFTLKLYDADSGNQLHTFTGHHDLVHDIAWNCLGTALVSASADCSAKVWTVDATRTLPPSRVQVNAVATLQHTSFVYSAVWHPKPTAAHLVVTGGFDGVLRFWDSRHGGTLLHAVDSSNGGHAAGVHLNSVVFAPNGTRIFTGDSAGTIKVWEDTFFTRAIASATVTPGDAAASASKARAVEANWNQRIRCLHTLTHADLVGVPITCLRYSARPERLVAYTRANALFVFSLLRYELSARLSGVPCHQHSLRFAISPDGAKLVAGAEDGSAYFFDLASSALELTLDLGFQGNPVFDIAWAPSSHALAAASFGADYPIKLLEWRTGAIGAQSQMSLVAGHNASQPGTARRDEDAGALASSRGLLGSSSALPPSLRTQAEAASAAAAISARRAPSTVLTPTAASYAAAGASSSAAVTAASSSARFARQNYGDDDDDEDGDMLSHRSDARGPAALGASTKRVTFGQQ